ncbi:MFS transporter [Sphaerisporangium rufum]|uniref:MFS transporter n=1 Tax=Sphaerisporangium rufum TaxID=1381558 RepID=A0A919R7C9_9ACTN|nr:MFS transporter [Sphaerisporangium rufum]GII80528.1 MFS transporter [Sphaerisporangium rufum]
MADLPPLRRQRDYRLLWTARAVSETGTEVSRVALPLTAVALLDATPFQMGLLSAAAWLPYLFIGLPAGAYADRLARRRPLLAGCEVLAALAVLTVPAGWAAGLLNVQWLIGVALLVGACGMLYRAAWLPHLPSVVAEQQRTAAIAGFQAVYSAAAVGGPGLAGLLVQAFAAPIALLVDGVSFLVSAVCLRAIRAPERPTPAASRTGILSEVRAGLRTVLSHRVLWTLIGAGMVVNLASAAQSALYVLFAVRTLGLPAAVVGLFTAGFGAGGLLGSVLAARIIRRFGVGRVLLAVTAAFPLEYVALASAHGSPAILVPVLVAAYVFSGVITVLFSVCYGTVQLRDTPADMLGRVNSIMTVGTLGVMAIGGVAGGLLGQSLGLRPALWVAAALLPAATFLVLRCGLHRAAPARPATDVSASGAAGPGTV